MGHLFQRHWPGKLRVLPRVPGRAPLLRGQKPREAAAPPCLPGPWASRFGPTSLHGTITAERHPRGGSRPRRGEAESPHNARLRHLGAATVTAIQRLKTKQMERLFFSAAGSSIPGPHQAHIWGWRLWAPAAPGTAFLRPGSPSLKPAEPLGPCSRPSPWMSP